MKEALNIVWLKRDLRTQDHAPFSHAEQDGGSYIPIYIFEPSALHYPDNALRHQRFIYHAILDMNAQLKAFQREVVLFHAEAMEVFKFLCDTYPVKTVYSHQESGVQRTWERDQEVARFFSESGVTWRKFQRDGVIRGIKNRDAWDQRWYSHVYDTLIENKFSKAKTYHVEHPYKLPEAFEAALKPYPEHFQKPGATWGWKYLRSFCAKRGHHYSKRISKPSESRNACGRVSPYLAWGNLSVRQIFQFVRAHPLYTQQKRSFNGLLTRLKWRCHFIQKFEMECSYEKKCVNRGYESMQYTSNVQFLNSWKAGKTGFPLVDACMRCLQATGWINFRMRAMLVSMLCHHLDCDWRKGVYHLAQLFLDYEPGIHYTQFQMQAGTTGINTIRMYNPIKQSQDHDPEGTFIKAWVPELRHISTAWIHEPWKMPATDQGGQGIQGESYPAPIVDLAQAGKMARDKIWGHRKHAEVRAENYRILAAHTRQNKGRRPTHHRAAT